MGEDSGSRAAGAGDDDDVEEEAEYAEAPELSDTKEVLFFLKRSEDDQRAESGA